MKKRKPITIQTIIKDITDFPGGIKADIVISTGGGTYGNWTIGWSFMTSSVVMVYEDGQVVSARTNKLFKTMTKFRKKPK